MELTYDELDLLINRLGLGKDILFIADQFITIQNPSNDLKVRAEVVRLTAYQKALDDGLLAREELEALVIERGIFSDEDERNVTKLRSKLEAQEILLSKTLKVKARQDRLRNVIKELKTEISTILYKKYSKLNMSAEVKADEEVNNYLCSKCVYLDSGEKYWSNLEAFLTDVSTESKSQIISAFLTLVRGKETELMRYVSRSTLWRIKYTTSMKTGEMLFGVPLSEYTTDQISLVYWSNYYDQIYNMMPTDRPPDDIIAEDDLLDKYMEEYYKEMNNETSISRGNKAKSRGALSAFDAEEVIVTQSNPLYEDIDYDKPRESRKKSNKGSPAVKADAKKIKVRTDSSDQARGIKK